MPCSLPRWSGSAHYVYLVGALPRRAFPDPLGLPHSSAGSAPTWSLSRPARASHALRPARLLIHHSWTLSRGSRQPRSQDCCSPAIESNHQLFEWVLPPLVICPFGARRRISMRHATVRTPRHGPVNSLIHRLPLRVPMAKASLSAATERPTA